MRSVSRCLLFTALSLSALTGRAQTISQDYARYAGMLNQERADAARREQQVLYDQSARNARSVSGGGSSSGSSGGSSSGPGAAEAGIGRLASTLSDMMARHNAAEASRRARSNDPKDADTYEEMIKRLHAKTEGYIAEQRKKDNDAFIKLTQQKAAAGDVEAGGQIGRLMVEGQVMKRDTKRGLELMTIAAEKGSNFIARFLAKDLQEGWYGVPVDLPKAHAVSLRAAEAGDSFSEYDACLDFVVGRGVKQDLNEAVRLCGMGFKNGSYEASELLGDLLSGAVPGIAPDYTKAEAAYRQAIQGRLPDAPDKLSRLLLHSRDGAPDYAKLLPLYEGLAEKGDRVAQVNLGELYLYGNGVPANTSKALEWLSTAVGGGSARAMFDLGTIWLTGDEYHRDLQEGLVMYRKAAVQGWPPALYAMGLRTLNGTDVPKDPAEGARLLQLAADKGDPDAPCALGQAYLQGSLGTKDPVAARKWLSLGADRGNQACVKTLQTL